MHRRVLCFIPLNHLPLFSGVLFFKAADQSLTDSGFVVSTQTSP